MNLPYAARAARRFCLFMLLVSAARAQEGHPMSGVWVGDWGFTAAERNRVVLVLDWSGTGLTGTLNPGPAAMPLTTATVNPDDWSVHLEAEARNREGQPVRYVIDGTLDDLGTYNRSLAGSWKVGTEQGTFSITRQ
jgi:hypothetical protein